MNSTGSPEAFSNPPRLASLDQFRGYTVVGMLLVNFMGGYDVTPELFKHHNTYISYADTIMPHFLFAVGFAYRLTFLRRQTAEGSSAAYRRVLKRLAGLFLVAIIVHAPSRMANTWEEWWQLGPGFILYQSFKSDYFQTLMHITVTSLWITPVIGKSAAIRAGYIGLSLLLHLFLSWWFYFDFIWQPQPCIDGGPLGFLTWSTCALGGSLAYDILGQKKSVLSRLMLIGIAAMGLGWSLSCGTTLYDRDIQSPLVATEGLNSGEGPLAESPVFPPAHARARLAPAEPPFVPPPDSRLLNYWMMSQRAGTISYLVFSSGLSFVVLAFFVLVADEMKIVIPFFRTFGSNALIAFILHGMVENALKVWAPRDCPAWYLATMVVIFFAANYIILRSLEQQKIFVRL